MLPLLIFTYNFFFPSQEIILPLGSQLIVLRKCVRTLGPNWGSFPLPVRGGGPVLSFPQAVVGGNEKGPGASRLLVPHQRLV